MKLLRNGIWGYPNLSFWIIVTQNISKINLLLFPVRWELWFSCWHHHHEWPPKALPPSAVPKAITRRLHVTWLGEGIIQVFILDRIGSSSQGQMTCDPSRGPQLDWIHCYTLGGDLPKLQQGLWSVTDAAAKWVCQHNLFTFLILFHLAPLPSTLYFSSKCIVRK